MEDLVCGAISRSAMFHEDIGELIGEVVVDEAKRSKKAS